MANVFISYKRHTEDDQPLAELLAQSLQARHRVFIDQTMRVGEDWVHRIKAEVEGADFLILLLSAQSIQSQMVVEEVRMADVARRQGGKPDILPVRVAYEGSLPYDLGAILNRLNYALWKSRADDEAVLRQIEAALTGMALPAPALSGEGLAPDIPLSAADPKAVLEAPEGTMSPESGFYVERASDRTVKEEAKHEGYTLTIRGPRQMGKSSLLGRVMWQARDAGKKVAFVDFQAFGRDVLSDAAKLYYEFCWLIEDALDLESELEKYWKAPVGEPQKCRRFMEKRILPVCAPNGLLLAIDEADSLLESPFRSDFFGMLRNWHNERAMKPAWKRFALAMVISTEPSMLITDLSQSPFNVGTGVPMEDLTLGEAAHINQHHGCLLNEKRLETLNDLLGGHPYLTRKALYQLGKDRFTFESMIAQADSETGPFGDHLCALLARLHLRPELIDALRRGLKGDRIVDNYRHSLIAGGLMREEAGRMVARNRLYDTYFRRVLHD